MSIGHLTFGTPEYVEATKLAERQGKTDELIDKIEALTEELHSSDYYIGSYEQRRRVNLITHFLAELI
ncbi:hypothetical protein [Bacillus glycinifermentans]|uniref:hypothetical protein n=1 Tax=Bacillus glycinifermentans TaxID=1664069 RepID=UPI000814B69B|nr:hypothetical protein [Bacillus glycinifermentans]WKB78757.1 hypothetical protein QYM22_07960 [Bacillus glycinifermentans]SCA85304.1 hypothetical protein BGLY_1481 [Bacillus glycinifermentans]